MASQQNGVFGPLGGLGFNFPKPKNKWDINVGDLGFSEGYGDKLNMALDGIFQKQLADTTNRAQEASLASGSFNPQVSQYYATQGARDAQAKGKVDALGQARADNIIGLTFVMLLIIMTYKKITIIYKKNNTKIVNPVGLMMYLA